MKKNNVIAMLFMLISIGVFAQNEVTFEVTNDWGSGYQAKVLVAPEAQIEGWDVTILLPVDNAIANLWGAEYELQGNQLVLSPMSYNAALNAGASVEIGFVVNATEDAERPSLVSYDLATVADSNDDGSSDDNGSSDSGEVTVPAVQYWVKDADDLKLVYDLVNNVVIENSSSVFKTSITNNEFYLGGGSMGGGAVSKMTPGTFYAASSFLNGSTSILGGEVEIDGGSFTALGTHETDSKYKAKLSYNEFYLGGGNQGGGAAVKASPGHLFVTSSYVGGSTTIDAGTVETLDGGFVAKTSDEATDHFQAFVKNDEIYVGGGHQGGGAAVRIEPGKLQVVSSFVGGETEITAGEITTQSIVVDGTIRAEEVIVEDIGADFVFEEDYELMELDELDAYIKANKHLPGVAPASETEKGVELAQFNELLLQKVEELTLYIIELQKQIDQIQK